MDSPQSSDVFSLSDHLLAERLQFVKEIGFGNWGSVWLCHPKSSSGKVKDIDVAVKLVHRSKTSTTAARVRSLWNEMKIVRSFKNDPHPSIVPFHSFIITPSYALITMAYLPTPVPVEVSETRAKGWFKSLLSGVHFLHARGVVHNDIKPANILLSPTNSPVLVDFGFAEKYDLSSPKAFHSNLTYGTPEYLSPERARGLPHDTRKSDIWSLGITFFEIIVGRTPFEYEEGEVFEKKEDLEKYWHRTMRGKWVGKYSMSQPLEHFLKRMIIPDADLRCTAGEVSGDAYWDTNTATSTHGHRQSASATLSSVNPRTHSLLDSVKDSFRDSEKERTLSPSRRFDIPLWSPSRSTSQSSVSQSACRTESTSRSASRLGPSSRPASREDSSLGTTSVISSASQNQVSGTPSEAPVVSNRIVVEGQASPAFTSPPTRPRTHSRSRSQPKLRAPPGISTAVRTKKLSTVQASPIMKAGRQFGTGMDPNHADRPTIFGDRGNSNARQAHTLVSANSNSSLKRPLGPRQPSPRNPLTPSTTKVSLISSSRAEITQKKHGLSHLAHSQTPEANHTGMPPSHLPTSANVPQTPTHTRATRISTRTPQTSCQTSVSKQLSGRPPRTRGRAGVLADLTGLARNVDLAAHGVGRSVRQGGEKKDRGKENAKRRTSTQKENKENVDLSSPLQPSRKDACVPNRASRPAAFSPEASVKVHDLPISISLATNPSGGATVTKGSVRDRMMDWERERERLREMVSMTDTSTEGHGDRESTILTRTSTDLDPSDDDDSEVEAEVAAEVASAQAKCEVPTEDETPKEDASVEHDSMRPRTSISSSSSQLERSQIEVAKVGVRASAQILSSHNGSISALGLSQSTEKQPSQESQVKNDTVTDVGLPVEINRHGESGFTSLKHSVKASIDKGVRFYKSSTLGQLAGRSTPTWAPPEPIDFEQRRSGEEGRFSWENIRPEHEVALDRMNLWIQSVEKVVEETCQNFASTTVIPPVPLPLSPTSRSSSFHGTLNASTSTTQNNNHNINSLNMSRSSRLPRRLLAAGEIFAEPTDLNAPLSPALSRGEDSSTSFSYIHTPESSVPVLPSISMLMQTPRRRRATISTRSPTQPRTSPAPSDVFDYSPSKRREKSKSQSNLDKHIKDVAKLELEISRGPISSPSPRLSAVFDKSLFVKLPLSPKFTEEPATTSGERSASFDELNSSPYHVEPYPSRKAGEQVVLRPPDKQHLEGVYDRFLMATSGVKRVGKGYQSDNFKSAQTTPNTTEHGKASHARGFGVFGTGKRPMPPPVSSEDAWRRSTSIDELGFITAGQGTNTSSFRTCKDESKRTFVRRAIQAMVPGKTASRRLSRTIVV